jgi:hypothetical protein
VAIVTTSTATELAAAIEIVGRYRERVAALATPHLGSDREDLLAAIYEAERSLRTAERALERAAKVAASGGQRR